MAAPDRQPNLTDARAVGVLQDLLAADPTSLERAMQQAAQTTADALRADKVDVFVFQPTEHALIALGTSDTPMGRNEKAAGLDRMPLDRGGRMAEVFHTRRSHLGLHTDQDPVEPAELTTVLGVRSTVASPLVIEGEVRGVVVASSSVPAFFSQDELRLLEAVARWVGLVGDRAMLVEQLAARAAEAGFEAGATAALDVLTPRQQDVARLIAQGLTNGEIARRLVLSPGTVANHIQQILHRLNLRGRTQLAVWVAERSR
jgi:two-component system, OmpR family, sensor kinase